MSTAHPTAAQAASAGQCAWLLASLACAAPATVFAASASAVSRGRPAATPPSASASIMRYTKAGPEPDRPAG